MTTHPLSIVASFGRLMRLLGRRKTAPGEPVAPEFTSAPRLISWGQWVVVPVLVALGIRSTTAEWQSVKTEMPEVTIWRAWSREVDSRPQMDFVFLGSSRVAASIDVGDFVVRLADRTGKNATALNFAMGYSTEAERFMYLRNQIRRHPEKFRGATIFIECPAGVPPDLSTWQDPWFHVDRPGLLTWVMRPSDVAGLWVSNRSPENATRFTFESLVRKEPVLAHRDKVGSEFVSRGNRWVHRAFDRLSPPTAPTLPAGTQGQADLTAAAGIRTDLDGVAAVRQMVTAAALKEMETARPRRVERHAVIADTVKLVQRAGGQVVFFEMPLHPIQTQLWEAGKRADDRAEFRKVAAKWGTPIIDAKLETQATDFPDVAHLRHSLAPLHSQKLADAFLDAKLPFTSR